MEPNPLQLQAVELMGGLVICFCFAFILYGITVAQTYVYMMNSKEDPLWLKAWVMVLCLLETLHTAFAMRLLYYYTVLSFGRLDMVLVIYWSLGAIIFIENMVVAMVDIFFIRRLWILSKHSYILTIGTSLLLLGRIVCHTATGVFALSAGTLVKFRDNPSHDILLQVSNILSAVLDGIIAISLMYFLWRGQSGQKSTDNIVRWLMGYAVNSGAIMMVVSITITIVYAAAQKSILFFGFVVAIAKLYANSLLGSLNARHFLRDMNMRNTTDSASRKPSAIELSKIHTTSAHRPIEIYRERTEITDVVGSRSIDTGNVSSWELQNTTFDNDTKRKNRTIV